MAHTILSDAERLAWERFPQDPGPDVVGVYSTLADGEVDDFRRLRKPAGRLATGTAVAAIRWLGFVPAELEHASTPACSGSWPSSTSTSMREPRDVGAARTRDRRPHAHFRLS